MNKFKIAVSTVLAASVIGGAVSPSYAGSGQIGKRGERREWIPWSVAAGRPDINFSRAVGIYIWHDGPTVHILSADQSRNGEIIHGTIKLHGKGRIYDLDRQQIEGGDHVGRHGDTIGFRLDTYNATDGFKFSLTGGDSLVIDIDQKGRNDRNVYIGRRQIAANAGVVVIDMRR